MKIANSILFIVDADFIGYHTDFSSFQFSSIEDEHQQTTCFLVFLWEIFTQEYICVLQSVSGFPYAISLSSENQPEDDGSRFREIMLSASAICIWCRILRIVLLMGDSSSMTLRNTKLFLLEYASSWISLSFGSLFSVIRDLLDSLTRSRSVWSVATLCVLDSCVAVCVAFISEISCFMSFRRVGVILIRSDSKFAVAEILNTWPWGWIFVHCDLFIYLIYTGRAQRNVVIWVISNAMLCSRSLFRSSGWGDDAFYGFKHCWHWPMSNNWGMFRRETFTYSSHEQTHTATVVSINILQNVTIWVSVGHHVLKFFFKYQNNPAGPAENFSQSAVTQIITLATPTLRISFWWS